ncbi:DNA replication origin-binding helicase [Murid herpesvirus 3]|uniref:Replication origin-binding protein n=2 Tax=Murid betaherpesvirus 3 TaxID=2560603 RepID=A0A1P8VIZ2_9BETA|nr:DNA replication origin-binding helicase [Murine roseolovirus]APZ76302.1 DNA replication origin-binding helicase [Murid betaherpesvirus 3]AYH64718.1 DNA replication origin-binding helicase [Murid herpesvirus 3]
MDEIMEQQLLKNCQILQDWFNLNTSDERLPDNVNTYLQNDSPVSFFNIPEPIKLVRAPIGSGKTTAMISWLNNCSPNDSVLIITYRKSIAADLQMKLIETGNPRFVLYSDIFTKEITNHPHLIIQIDSLHRLTSCYDIILMDEVMFIISQFFSKTMRYISHNDRLLLENLACAKHIIAMDTTLNNCFVYFMAKLRANTKIALINNSFTSVGFSARRAVFCATCYGDCGFFEILLNMIRQNKKVGIFCNTISAAEHLKEVISSAFPPIKILVVTSRQGQATSATLWPFYNVIIYNTIVSPSFQYTRLDFCALFCYIQMYKGGPDIVTIFQSMCRIRSLRDNVMYIYLNPSLIKLKDPAAPLLIPICTDSSIQSILSMNRDDFIKKCVKKTGNSSIIKDCFRPRYVIDRVTLNSLSDSFFLLCLLIENNLIPVRMIMDSNEKNHSFVEFFKTVINTCSYVPKRIDDRCSVKDEFIQIMSDKKITFDGVFYTNEIFKMHYNYLSSMTKLSELFISFECATLYIDKLMNPKFKFSLVNILATNYARQQTEHEKIEAYIKHLSSYIIYNDLLCTTYSKLTSETNLSDINILVDMASLGAEIIQEFNLASCTDIHVDIKPEDVVRVVEPREERMLSILQIIFSNHHVYYYKYNHRLLCNFSRIKNMKNPAPVASESHYLALLRAFFKAAYNMSIMKAKSRYDTKKPFRCMNKKDIEDKLNEWNVDKGNATKYRTLRKMMTEAKKKKCAEMVYKLIGDDVSASLKNGGSSRNRTWSQSSDSSQE